MKAEFTVKVGGHDIQVVEAPTTDMLHDYLGTWATETNRITLRKNLPPHRRVEVFLHELTHIILLAQGLEEGKEERVVNALGEGMTAFIRDNPEVMVDLLKTLTQKEERQDAPIRQQRPTRRQTGRRPRHQGKGRGR